MNLRETLARRPQLGMGMAAVLVVFGVFFVYVQIRAPAPTEELTRSFFTVDNGKTWFVDDINKIPPFDKDGKQAVAAAVFRCADGKEFVGYLQRFTPKAKRELEQLQNPDPNATGKLDPNLAKDAFTAGREVKRPADTVWTSAANGRASSKITAVKCPEGGNATRVDP